MRMPGKMLTVFLCSLPSFGAAKAPTTFQHEIDILVKRIEMRFFALNFAIYDQPNEFVANSIEHVG